MDELAVLVSTKMLHAVALRRPMDLLNDNAGYKVLVAYLGFYNRG